ncbi:Stealth CR1 domain-containing protein [bacterium]|nr:Stealth CR1 domain-containing protein [bacterium]
MAQSTQNFIENFPVDIVYLWCDSSDKVWREKKNNELKKYGKSLDNDSVSECRFINNDELKYSLRSLEKFASWINNIYIVTDNQVPDWLDTTNPKIHIVDHSEILSAEVLPTFNASAIEVALHKIPDLSEHFLFANDDMFFGNFVEKSFFYNKDGSPIFRFSKRKIINKIYRHLYGYMIFRAYNLVKEKFGKSCPHFPHHNIDAYRKSDVEKCYFEYKEGFDQTEKQKFREKECIQRSIFSYYAIAKGCGTFKIVDTFAERFIAFLTCQRLDSLLVELRKSKLELIRKYKPCLFCLNDSLKTTDDDRLAMRKFLEEKFPKASSFEKSVEGV